MTAPIDAATSKRLAIKLAAARKREEIFIEAALFSAYDAALQVHGTQIGFLQRRLRKQSEDFGVGEFFADVVINLLVGAAASKLLEVGLEQLLRPIIRSRQAYYVMPKLPTSKRDLKIKPAPHVRLDVDAIKKARAQAHSKLKAHFAEVVNTDDFSAYKAIPQAIGESLLSVGIETAGKPTAASPSPPPLPTSSRAQDTPVVQVVASVQTEYVRQTVACDAMWAELVATLQYEPPDKETAAEWESFLDENGATGMRLEDLKTYRKLLFSYYEFAIWAHSFDFKALVSSSEFHTSGYTQNGARGHFAAPDNYILQSQSEEQVAYRVPRPSSVGITDTDVTALVSKERLEYWIRRFPWSWDELQGPTILEHYEDRYKNYYRRSTPSDAERTQLPDAIRVMAYDKVLDRFRTESDQLLKSYRALTDAGALLK